jgi:hypothetical protein
MTTITWNISVLDCLPQSAEGADYVVTAHWQCTGVDGEYSGSVYSTCSFPVVEGTSFTPYADLTLDQVLGWIWANGVDKDATEAAVEQQIETQKNPPIVNPPLPWVSP